MAKMTAKEFKKVLEVAGMDFDIWGYEGILNIVSIHLERSAKDEMIRYKNTGDKGWKACAESDRKKSDSIYESLKSKGYYNR